MYGIASLLRDVIVLYHESMPRTTLQRIYESPASGEPGPHPWGGALWLASPLSSYMTGPTMVIDGGRQFI